jgi:pimeloyl-ACP methyl ester carboxylesterase
MRRVALVAILVLGLVPAAQAQDRLTVFLHGFNSNAGTWWGTATRLQSRLQVAAAIPELPWHLPFDAQANHLNSLANSAGAPANTVVVGHSNGGVVARQLSTKRALGGLVSLGSPHLGAPLAQNIQWAAFHYLRTGQELGHLLVLLGASNGTNRFSGLWFSPGLTWLRVTVALTGAVLQATVADTALAIWPLVTAPVLTDMQPGSAALATLNSGGNLARESGAVPRRVGMVFTARDWWLGAPFVASAPEKQYWGHAGIVGGIQGLEFIRAYFDYPNFAPWDPVALTIRNQASLVISQLLAYNSTWCIATTYDPSCSMSTDGVVPTPSQYFPGNAANVGFYGPAHLRQKDAAADALHDVLVQRIGLLPRAGAPTNPGNPGGAPSSTLSGGERLYPDQFVRSPNGAYTLTYQMDGNLVLYGPQGDVWSSSTHGSSPGFATMQGDGNLVVYRGDGVPIWATDTPDIPGAELRVQDDGYIVLYDAGNNVIWYAPH